MAEGGRIEPGRHAGTPASPVTETRRLVEDGGYAGRHEAPGPVQIADGKSQRLSMWSSGIADLGMTSMEADPLRCSNPPEESCSDAGCPVHGGEGPEGDWGPGDDDPPDYQHPED